MPAIQPGNVPRLTVEWKNFNGVLTEPSNVKLEVTDPTGTVTTPAPTQTGAGVWHYDLLVEEEGVWKYRWTAIGALEGVQAGELLVEKEDGWTYGNPAVKTLWAVRFEIQDTNEQAPLLQDGEIEYALLIEGVNSPENSSQTEVLEAGAHCMEALSRRFAALADRESGTLKIVSTKRAAVYAERAADLRLRAQELHAPFAGGISRSEKQAQRENPNREGSMFRLRQFQNRRGRGGPWGGGW